MPDKKRLTAVRIVTVVIIALMAVVAWVNRAEEISVPDAEGPVVAYRVN